MFKKRSSAAVVSATTRRPGQALEALEDDDGRQRQSSSFNDGDSGDDSSPSSPSSSSPSASSVVRPLKRLRRAGDGDAAAVTASSPPSTSSGVLDPTLVTVPSSRSALPDVSTHSHRFARFAPKHAPPPLTTPTSSPSLTLPPTSFSPAVGRYGPQKANGYARAISRVDYQPDLCKDWKECGSCGYGDSCKFLHDRLDYKQGWQLDAEWEEQKKKEEEEKRKRGGGGVDVGSDASHKGGGVAALPFACYLCRRPFTQPVVTACGHYFDERCALARFAQSSRCAICGKETHGSFTTATDILAHTRRREGEEKEAPQMGAADDSDDSSP